MPTITLPARTTAFDDPTEIPMEDATQFMPITEAQPHTTIDLDDPDLGASTAEYAVIVLAAAAFGGVMAAVLSSDSVSGMLLGIIQKALAV
ncbi:DUF4244 domain-containing protein [Kocuria marina]|uniref:DUF4244 domain-containing protein n=1 Tax=Kocuria marina TaxID=223184 RepID=UPI0022E263F5|nr:DUF4244 domain-containing protein [Kocuria marina]